MSKNIWRLLSVVTLAIAVVSFIVMLVEVHGNYVMYDMFIEIRPHNSYYWLSYAVLIYLIGLIIILMIMVVYSIIKKKKISMTFLITAFLLMVSKFVLMGAMEVIVNVSDAVSWTPQTIMVDLFRVLDTNNNLIYVFNMVDNFQAPNFIVATEVIPVSFILLGLYLGTMNKKYFVVVSIAAVLVTTFMAFASIQFNNPYFNLQGVFSVLSVGLIILSYSFNTMAVAERIEGVAL